MNTNINIKEDINEEPLEQRFWSKVNKRNFEECWEWDGNIGSDGYGQFWFKRRMMHAHRVAWMIKNDKEIPEGMIALHNCDNKRCVNPYHIKIGTYSDNMADRMERTPHRMGRISRFYIGEVWLMKKLNEAKFPQWYIARMFKTSQGHISNLVNNIRGTNVMPHVEVTNEY